MEHAQVVAGVTDSEDLGQAAVGGQRADDIVLLLPAVAGITRRAGTVATAATERFVALALDGFRAEGARPAPPPVPVFPGFGGHLPEPAVK